MTDRGMRPASHAVGADHPPLIAKRPRRPASGARLGDVVRELERDHPDLAADAPVSSAALEVGEQIKTLRLAAGLSQRELAAAAGLHQSALSAMERGEGKDGPTYRKLRMIAKAMGLRMVFVPNEVRENTASHAVEAVCTPSPGKQYRISGSEKVASKQSRKFRSLLSTQVRALNVPSKTKTRRA